MSKKKRNRRPSPISNAGAPTGSQVAHEAVPGESDATQGDAAPPSPDAALATGVRTTESDAGDAQAAPSDHPLDSDANSISVDDMTPATVASAVGATNADRIVEPTEYGRPAAAKSSERALPPVGNPFSGAGDESGDIRGVLIQIGGGRLLLPNATIAEVLSYAEPEADGSAADWMLGRFRWRGWQIPLIAFSRLSGIGEDTPGLGSKVIVLKALGGDRRTPFFAIVTQGFPRLVTVSRTALSVEASPGELPPGVQALVRLNDEPALLPDLLHIEERLRELREAA